MSRVALCHSGLRRDGLRRDALSRDALPGDARPSDALPRDALSRNSLSHDGLPRDLPRDALSHSALCHSALSHDALSRNGLPRNALSPSRRHRAGVQGSRARSLAPTDWSAGGANGRADGGDPLHTRRLRADALRLFGCALGGSAGPLTQAFELAPLSEHEQRQDRDPYQGG